MKKQLLSVLLAIIIAVTAIPGVNATWNEFCPCARCVECRWCMECEDCPPERFRIGDVDGDGVLSYNDIDQIINFIVRQPNTIVCYTATNIYNSLNNPLYNPEQQHTPTLQDALHILRRFVGLPSALDHVWEDDEIRHVWVSEPIELTGEICLSRGLVTYRTKSEIMERTSYSLIFDVPHEFVRGMSSDEYDALEEIGGGFFINTSLNSQWMLLHRFGGSSNGVWVPEGGVIAHQAITGNVTPEDFTLHPEHDTEVIIWEFCNHECCNPPCDCLSCTECGYRGGRFGFGRVNGGEHVTVQDALAILRFIVGLPSPIDTCADARAAAMITNPLANRPSLQDALAILRHLVDSK